MLKLYFYLAIIFLTSSCGQKNTLTTEEVKWLEDQKNITVSAYGNYPPYQFKNSYGEIEGVFVDYLQAIEEQIGFKFKFRYYNDDQWHEILEDVKNDKLDIVLEIQKTKPRTKYLNFFSELFDSQHIIATRKEDINNITSKNIDNKKVVVPKDFAIANILRTKYPTIKLFYKKNEADCLKALSNGMYDAYIGPDANTNYHIKNKGLKNLIINGQIPYKYKPTIAVSKKMLF